MNLPSLINLHLNRYRKLATNQGNFAAATAVVAADMHTYPADISATAVVAAVAVATEQLGLGDWKISLFPIRKKKKTFYHQRNSQSQARPEMCNETCFERIPFLSDKNEPHKKVDF